MLFNRLGSIDPELLRLSVSPFGTGFDASCQLLLYALLESVISEHPGFIGCFPDFFQVAFGYAVLE